MWEPGTLLEYISDERDWRNVDDGSIPKLVPYTGHVYTLVEELFDEDEYEVWLAIEELAPEDIVWPKRAFRPITESRLSIFRSLLTETPKTVNVGEEA